jgi:hypothetical protein
MNVKLQRETYPRNAGGFNETLPCTRFGGTDPDCLLMRRAEIVDVTGG